MSRNTVVGVAVPVSVAEPVILEATANVVPVRPELSTWKVRPLKEGVVVKPERVIGSPAVKVLGAVNVTIPSVPDHAVIVALPAVATILALPFKITQFGFELKSGTKWGEEGHGCCAQAAVLPTTTVRAAIAATLTNLVIPSFINSPLSGATRRTNVADTFIVPSRGLRIQTEL